MKSTAARRAAAVEVVLVWVRAHTRRGFAVAGHWRTLGAKPARKAAPRRKATPKPAVATVVAAPAQRPVFTPAPMPTLERPAFWTASTNKHRYTRPMGA